jgi:uncharacterized membrane protein (UPF0127 family)
MFERVARLVLLPLASLCAAAAPPPVATVPCANVRLPQSILDGISARPLSDPLPTIEVRATQAALHLAVVDSEPDREFGLMCVTRLRSHAGMLFVFERDANWEFWMKNTLIPLDMIWLERDGRVSALALNVPESTLETSDDAVARRTGHGRYVIELPAGEALGDGLKVGRVLHLPRLPSTAPTKDLMR